MRRMLCGLALLLCAPTAQGAPGPSARATRLVGLVLSSRQALVWDGATRRYRLLTPGARFQGARVLGLGVDRVLAERRGVKFIWKLNAPPLLHPAGATRRQARRPTLIITPEAPPPPRAGPARPRPGASRLPPVPRAGDAPRRVVRRRATLPLAVLSALARDFRSAQAEVRFERRPGRRVRIRWVRAGGVLSPLGLRAGDVIRRVQGRAVGSAADAAEIFVGLRRGARLRVELIRGDHLVELSVRLR